MNDNAETRTHELTLHMEGMDAEGGDLRLGVFVDKLDALRAALQEADRLVRGENKAIDFLVADLTHNSPAAVTINGGTSGSAQASDAFDYFSTLVSGLSARSNATRTSVFLLERILELCTGYGERFSRMWISRGGKVISSIDARTKEGVQAILGRTTLAIGSVKGTVERYNSHGEKMYFFLYPLVGQKVKCWFDNDHRDKAARAVDKNVTVSGRLSFYEGEFFPYQIDVDRIDINSDEQTWASLAGMIGSAPNSTGEQSSTDFIRDIRDGWH